MSDKRSHKQLDTLRERLYSRGEEPREHKRVALSEEEIPIAPKSWDVPPPPPKPPTTGPSVIEEEVPLPPPVPPATKRKYRKTLVLIGLAFFMISVALSSLYILLGRNMVSGSNISVGITGPFTIGGGEVMSMQVGITNQNSVPIEYATLIIEYPPGTRSAEGESRELKQVRENLPNINAGETISVPIKARIFGEENQEANIKVSVEYRVSGSNATFYKEAEPLRFKIGSAPIVLSVVAENSISSGQETTIKLTVKSNSPTPLNDILVRADYPAGFEFRSSNPQPVSGRNVWLIKEIAPEGSATLDITGVVVGSKDEKRNIKFSAGVAGERDPNTLGSILAMTDTEFSIEEPFLTFDVTVGGSRDQTVTIAEGSQATVSVEMTNNSDNIVYDGVVEVLLSGNALADTQVNATGGYYNSNTRTIRFDVSSQPRLERIEPGATERFSFSLRPSASGLQTPQLQLEVKATGRRVSESSAREEISGTIKRTIRMESKVAAEARVVDVVSGPVPPVVGRSTGYRIEWRVMGGNNNLSGAVVTATLPTYVDWSGSTAGTGTWSYNPSTRVVEWRVGTVAAGGTVAGTFGVSILPSSSQIGRTPTLVEGASLRADDSFTNSVLRASGGSVSTEIQGQQGSGSVQAN